MLDAEIEIEGLRSDLYLGMEPSVWQFGGSKEEANMFLRPRNEVVLGAAIIVAGAIFLFGSAWAGTTGQLSGVIHDAKTGEPISLASVAVPELKRGAVTDAQGSYSILNLPAGRYSVRVSLLGYVSTLRQNVEIIPDFNTKLDLNLESTVLTNVPEVIVKGERPLIQVTP